MIQEYYPRDKYPDICIRHIVSHLNAIGEEEAGQELEDAMEEIERIYQRMGNNMPHGSFHIDRVEFDPSMMGTYTYE